LLVAVAVLNDYNQRYQQQQQQQRVKNSLHNRMTLDTDAGQSSYRRDADHDTEEAFLLHTSWMDWRHGVTRHHHRRHGVMTSQSSMDWRHVPQHSSRRSTLIGQ